MTILPVILVTQSMKIVEKLKHIGIITFKGSTNLDLGEHARARLPLIETVRFAESLRELA